MQLNDTAIVLNTRKYNDSSMIMKVITENHGIYSGLVRIKKKQGGFGVNIAGNKLNLTWRARLSEHLGFFTTELNKSRAHNIMKNPVFLSGVNLICSHLDLYPEREPCPNIYLEFDKLIENFKNKEEKWIKHLILFELNYLEFMGFGIDLSECALTGENDSLEWVSPKSGRAVSSIAGKKWSKKLLKIPPFLLNSKQDVSARDLIDGLNLTGYFLNKQIYSELNRELPSSRKKIIDSLNS